MRRRDVSFWEGRINRVERESQAGRRVGGIIHHGKREYRSPTQGALRWAAQLWGAAEALREAIDVPRLPVDRVGYEQAVAAAWAQLGEEAFAAAWQEGWMMKLEQVIDEATHR